MTTLKFQSSRMKLNLLEDSTKGNQLEDRPAPFSSRLNSHRQDEIFKTLSSFRDGLQKQMNEKLKTESNATVSSNNKEISMKFGLGLTGLGSDKAQPSTSIHRDLMNAARGHSSGKERNMPPKSDNFNQQRGPKQEFNKAKAPEPGNLKHTQLSSSIADKFSKISFVTNNSISSPKGSFNPITFGNTSPEKREDSSAFRQKLESIKNSLQFRGESKPYQLTGSPGTNKNTRTLSTFSKTADLNKLFDSIGEPNPTPRAKVDNARAINPLAELSQELNRIRSYSQRDLAQDNLEKDAGQFAKTVAGTTLVTPLGTERATKEKTHRAFLSEDISARLLAKKKEVNDLIPLSKVQEFREIIVDANDEDFRNLPTSYLEELESLGAAILEKIKKTNRQNKETKQNGDTEKHEETQQNGVTEEEETQQNGVTEQP